MTSSTPEIDPARLVVLADSLAFHGPDGPLPPRWPTFFPTLLAEQLTAQTGREWQVTVVAQAGWNLRNVWVSLQKDLHLVQDVVTGADAIVLAVGSFDWVPVGVPTPLRALIPYVRPTALRRRLRHWIDRNHARLVRLTDARIIHTPPTVFAHSWRKSVEALRLFAPDAALAAVLPSVHQAPYYAHRHPHHSRGMAMTEALGNELQVPLVDLAALTQAHAHELNSDGIHWGWTQHQAVADAFTRTLLPQLWRDEAREPA